MVEVGTRVKYCLHFALLNLILSPLKRVGAHCQFATAVKAFFFYYYYYFLNGNCNVSSQDLVGDECRIILSS